MTPPEAPRRDAEAASGASLVSETVERGKGFWAWVQRTRAWRTFSRFTDVGGSVLTGGMSYQALFAVFAALWLGFGIFGILLRSHDELFDTLVTQINGFVPGLLSLDGQPGAVDPALLLQARTLDWTSAVAGASLLWVAVNWFTGTRRSLRLIFGLEVKQYSNALLLKLRDLVLAVVFFLLILTSAALTVASTTLMSVILDWLGASPDNWLLGTLGRLVRYAVMVAFDTLLLAIMHRYLAEIEVPWRRLLMGCLVGGLALLGLKLGGTALLGGATSNPLLATFAVVVGLLIWFNLICRALLLTSSWIACGLDRALGVREADLGTSDASAPLREGVDGAKPDGAERD
ncbi:YhjD/YihY/BrkB family envelope integrity protein [Leucobacter sp. gxy201]|uniref:YihY/virulence factor BrkB family protein n=1 Tax=Leucobacter sp. gxy201 TaxID=2957200 RepID=UPI003DA16F11